MSKNKLVNIRINLIPQDPFFKTAPGRILKWALTAGRYIVIFTELIVIISFITRFTLDRQDTDLNNSIHQKKVIIESYGDFEQQFRETQRKISDYQQIEQLDNLADVFPSLTEIIPKGVVLENLSIQPDQVFLSGTVLSQLSLNLLINNIQISKEFNNVVVRNVETIDEKTPGYLFTLEAKTSYAPVVEKKEKQ
jgi:Tfp pilus assembly protein PilN